MLEAVLGTRDWRLGQAAGSEPRNPCGTQTTTGLSLFPGVGDSTSKWAGRTREPIYSAHFRIPLSQGTMGPISGPSAAACFRDSTEDVLVDGAHKGKDPAPSSSQPTPSPCAFRTPSSPQRWGGSISVPLITSALKTDFRGHWHSLSSAHFICVLVQFPWSICLSGELQNITYLNNSFLGCEMSPSLLSSVLYQRGTLGSTSLLSFVYHFNVAKATTA